MKTAPVTVPKTIPATGVNLAPASAWQQWDWSTWAPSAGWASDDWANGGYEPNHVQALREHADPPPGPPSPRHRTSFDG